MGRPAISAAAPADCDGRSHRGSRHFGGRARHPGGGRSRAGGWRDVCPRVVRLLPSRAVWAVALVRHMGDAPPATSRGEEALATREGDCELILLHGGHSMLGAHGALPRTSDLHASPGRYMRAVIPHGRVHADAGRESPHRLHVRHILPGGVHSQIEVLRRPCLWRLWWAVCWRFADLWCCAAARRSTEGHGRFGGGGDLPRRSGEHWCGRKRD
mmetsp:Transcript_2057/g.5850  ORF Transcript_2057/g.5850 Transcript_2057/m.5850 type:complete len:214 (+) Transcript_2057:244-885(+)